MADGGLWTDGMLWWWTVALQQRWARIRSGSDWIRTEPILAGWGLDRTAIFL